VNCRMPFFPPSPFHPFSLFLPPSMKSVSYPPRSSSSRFSFLAAQLKLALSFLRLQKPENSLPFLHGAPLLWLLLPPHGSAFRPPVAFRLLDTALCAENPRPAPSSAHSAFTLAPLAEEALFRGYFFRKMGGLSGLPGGIAPGREGGPSRENNWLVAAALSSLLFAQCTLPTARSRSLRSIFNRLLLCYFSRRSGSSGPRAVACSFNFLSYSSRCSRDLLGIESTAHTIGAGICESSGGKISVLANAKRLYRPPRAGIIRARRQTPFGMVRTVVAEALSASGLSLHDVGMFSFSRGRG